MPDGPRILVAAALAKIIEPLLRQSFSDATIRIAEDQASVERAIRARLRFDVVIIATRVTAPPALPPPQSPGFTWPRWSPRPASSMQVLACSNWKPASIRLIHHEVRLVIKFP